jgi:hypothetical protein
MKGITQLTLTECLVKYPPTSSRGKFHNIRINARKVMKDNNVPKECKVCGYSTYVEVCHIKAIADFSKETLIKEINSLSNLIYLCPNHHIELDKGLLNLKIT